MNINLSFFSGREKIKKQKDALEAARLAILRAHKVKCVKEKGGMPYCDCCPVSAIGHAASKTITYEQSKIICPLNREYTK